MKFNQLRYLAAIVETGSLRSAARELRISEPALSKSIHQLEEMLEVKLIDRNSRGIVPTVFGESLATHASLVLNQLSQGRRELDEIKGAGKGIITIGTGPTAATSNLPMAVRAFKRKYPDVKVIVREGVFSDLAPQVLQGKLDFAIVAHPSGPVDADLDLDPLPDSPVGVVARRGHPLMALGEVTIADLVDSSWLLAPKGDEVRERFEQITAKYNIAPIRIIAESSSILFITKYVSLTDTLAFLPQRLIQETQLLQGELVALDLPQLFWDRPLALLRRRRFSLSPATITLLREVRATYAGASG